MAEKLTKDQILIDTISKVLLMGQLYRLAVHDLAKSETLALWTKIAKENGNKSYIDIRPKAADNVRAVDAMVLTIKKAISPETFRLIHNVISDDAIHELNLLLLNTCDLTGPTIAGINEEIVQGRKNNTVT